MARCEIIIAFTGDATTQLFVQLFFDVQYGDADPQCAVPRSFLSAANYKDVLPRLIYARSIRMKTLLKSTLSVGKMKYIKQKMS